jgi:hypothetical protein
MKFKSNGKVIVSFSQIHFMKQLTGILFLIVAFGCNNATDGDASTDTTTMPVDTALLNPSDTAAHINTSTGTYPLDTTTQKSSRQGSSPTNPASRQSTPGAPNNENRDTTRF